MRKGSAIWRRSFYVENSFLIITILMAVIIRCGCNNSAVSIPESIEQNCIGFLTGTPQEIATIEMIGGGWTRPHPGPFAWGWIETSKDRFNFDEVDWWVKNAQNCNVAILATIWPYAEWDQQQCHGQECEVTDEDIFYSKADNSGIPTSRCAPCNFSNYKDFLSQLVERYDGDGTSDMPGLKIPIKYWEILNEPSMHGSSLTFYKGTQEEYVEIMKASSEAIKSSCLDCMVVQGGAAGISDDTLAYWEGIFNLGGSDYFDVANVHYIKFGDLASLNVKDFKYLLQQRDIDKHIWVTEAKFTSESEVENAVKGALEAGASKIFFTTFKIGETGPPKPGEYSSVYENIVEKCP